MGQVPQTGKGGGVLSERACEVLGNKIEVFDRKESISSALLAFPKEKIVMNKVESGIDSVLPSLIFLG